MQMVRIYREQRAEYEYVKWEMKQNERERERERNIGGGVRSGAGLNENGNGRDRGWYLASFRGKYDRKGEEDTNGSREAFNDRRSSIASRASWVRDLFSSVFLFFFFCSASFSQIFADMRENRILG